MGTQPNLIWKEKKKKILKDKVEPWLLPLTFTSTYICEVTIVPKVCNSWESDLMKLILAIKNLNFLSLVFYCKQT